MRRILTDDAECSRIGNEQRCSQSSTQFRPVVQDQPKAVVSRCASLFTPDGA